MKNQKYPWLICFTCCLIILCSIGFSSTGFSIFVPYIKEATGLTNTATNSIVTIRQAASVIFLFFLAPIQKRIGSKRCLVIAMLSEMLCFILYANAKSYFVYAIGAIFASIGYSLGGIVIVSYIITNWFISKKALATSLCLAGSGLSTVIFAPVLTGIVEKYSLSTAFYFLAAFLLFVALLSVIVLSDTPEERGMVAYQVAGGNETKEKLFGKGLNQKAFNIGLIGFFFVGIDANIGAIYNPSLYRTAGFDSYTVALLSSLLGITIIVGKILYGALTEKKGSFFCYAVFQILFLIGTLLSMLANNLNVPMAVIAMTLEGLGISTTTIGLTLSANSFASKENYAKRLSLMQTTYACGGVLSGLVSGTIADKFGSYVPVMFVNSLNIIISGVIIVVMYIKVNKIDKE